MGYYLPRNERNEIPSRWLFFDAETKTERRDDGTEIQTLAFGWALFWYRERPTHPEQTHWHRFETSLEFIHLLHQCTASKERLMVCAHNLQFDSAIVGLIPHLSDLGYTVDYFISDYGRQLYKLHCDARSVLCVDSYNWFPFALDKIGASLGLEKLPLPDRDAPADEWDTYCQRDVRIVKGAVQRWLSFVHSEDLGNFAPTIAGQAFNAYRHRFLSHKLLVDNDRDRVALARSGYYGGRTEAFHLGKLPPGEYTMLDVNSLYPSVMHTNEYPTRVTWSTADGDDARAMHKSDARTMIAEVTLDTDAPLYPKRLKSHLAFPIGTFKTVLAGPELQMAADRNHVKQLHRWVAYEVAPIFTDYVEHFYELRRRYTTEGDAVSATIAKLLLNTLYGKFGQRTAVWQRVDGGPKQRYASWEEWNCDLGQWERYRVMDGTVYLEREPSEAHFAIPSIAAFVTSYARCRMISLIEAAGWEHVYYTDTDSLLVDSVGHSRLAHLISAERLGALKVVKQGQEVQINGLKDYLIDGDRTASGLKKDSVALPDGSFSTYDFWGITHNWAAGVTEGVVVRHYIKSLARRYAKGVVTATGAVEPLVLSE